jgi:hypothetical protein
MGKKLAAGPTLFDLEIAGPAKAVDRAIIATVYEPPPDRGAESVHYEFRAKPDMSPIVPPTDPKERLAILSAAVIRAIAKLYDEDRATARAILCVGLEDAGITEDPTR